MGPRGQARGPSAVQTLCFRPGRVSRGETYLCAAAHLKIGFALLPGLLPPKFRTGGRRGWGGGALVVGQPSLPSSRMEAVAGRSPQQPLRPPPFHLVQETGHRTAKVTPRPQPQAGFLLPPPPPNRTGFAYADSVFSRTVQAVSKQHVPKSITESISTAFLGCHLL